MSSEELIQSAVEIIDSAHSYGLQMSQLLDTLTELEDQVRNSASQTVHNLKAHFARLKMSVCEALDARLQHLVQEVDSIQHQALTPLQQSRALIENNVESASKVMKEGGALLAGNPENSPEKIIKFRENPLVSRLNSFPELPSPSEVACITMETTPGIQEQLAKFVMQEGKVMARAPVQILHVEGKPGGLQVQWAEVEEDSDMNEFMLQYACGQPSGSDDSRLLFHTAYEGPASSFTVKNLRRDVHYTFRVCGRVDKSGHWSPWSICQTAVCTILHHRWGEGGEAYSLSNEGRTATRMGEGLTQVLYSDTRSYSAGDTLVFRILDSADVSPGDGLAIVCDVDDGSSCNRQGAIFVNTYGTVFVDAQEMKTKLPPVKKGTILTFQTESLPNGKVRVSVQVDDKEVTLDWKVPPVSAPQALFMEASVPSFYFALRFAQEHWKVGVE